MKLKYKKAVISLSGGFFSNPSLIKSYGRIIKKIKPQMKLLCIVSGGGKAAREYISIAKSLGLSRKRQDEIGIAITRVNALLLGMLLNFKDIPTSYDAVLDLLKKHGFAICGGMKPRQSTDKVAADIAALAKAQVLVNLTKVDGVYDRNPKLKGARLISSLSYNQLRKILSKEKQEPGKYALFDLKAIQTVKKAKIPVIIANGMKAENLLKILRGEKIGTTVFQDS